MAPKAKSRRTLAKDNMPADYFVAIPEPLDIRKKILETSKETVKLLQMHNNIADIRQKKQSGIEELSQKLSDLQKLVGALKRMVPEAQAAELNKDRASKLFVSRMAKESAAEILPETQMGKSKQQKNEKEIDALERELSEIEERLGRI
jgi:archaellum component FlaC